MKRLTLIMPSIGRKPNQRYVATWQMEPLVLAVLAALTPSDWEITIQDDRIEPVDTDKPADLVGITTETYTARRAYQIAAKYRQRGIPVIMGGYHPTLWPDEVEKYADAIVVGPAEGIWEQVLADARAGTLKKRYNGPFDFPWKGIYPRREVYADKNYLPLALVEFSRGCSHHCSFCSITSFTRGCHYFRPPEEVAEEIKKTGQKIVFLIDDNIAANPQAVLDLCRALKPLNIKWVTQISVEAAADPQLIKALAESGCNGVLIGFESLRSDLLSGLNKKSNESVALYEKALEQVKKNNICVYATFLFGIDGDDTSSFKRTLDFALKHQFFLVAFNHLVPFPGTALYAKLAAQGRMTSDAWWLDPKFSFGQVPYYPQMLKPDELAEWCREYRKKFYSLKSIVRRGLAPRTQMQSLSTFLLYLTQNYYGRREVDEKFGIPLGFPEDDHLLK
ncbi:MAG: radical SAM protein [Candidatus Riflebacteria bacterium]